MPKFRVRRVDDRWQVRKRDGAWWVLDAYGRLRYSAGTHGMALAFALVRANPKPRYTVVFDHLIPEDEDE